MSSIRGLSFKPLFLFIGLAYTKSTMSKYFLAIVVVSLVIIGGAFFYYKNQQISKEMCPAIARICPDDSTALQGPKCTHLCPGEAGYEELKSQLPPPSQGIMNDGNGVDGSDGSWLPKSEEQQSMEYSGKVLAGTKAKLLEFNKADFDKAIDKGGVTVLYFYANWCPICKKEFPEMQAAFNSFNEERVIGFRVNFKDSETSAEEESLAREFGVPYQHTKIFVKGGKQTLKAPDGWTKDRYIAEIHKALEQ